MSIFRTSKQVAFTDLLVATEETVDNYRDLAKVLEGSAVAAEFVAFAEDRKTIIARLETEMRLLHDLPSPPNVDKEDFGKIVHRIRAAFSKDDVHPALQEMLDAEQHTLELIAKCEKEDLTQSEKKIIADLAMQVALTISRLHQMAADTIS